MDLGDLNEAELLDDSDLTGIEGFPAPSSNQIPVSSAPPSFGDDFGFGATPFSQPAAAAAAPSFDSFGGFEASPSPSPVGHFEAPESLYSAPSAVAPPASEFVFFCSSLVIL